MENANHKPGGGDKKIETIKTDFKDKAKPKVGSKDNVKHAPGGGDIKVRCSLQVNKITKTFSIDTVRRIHTYISTIVFVFVEWFGSMFELLFLTYIQIICIKMECYARIEVVQAISVFKHNFEKFACPY